jgi:general nucleoside transport system permease protein
LPVAALLVALIVFGGFCALAGANPFAVYGSIYKAAFGRWSAWQNTLIRAAPLMLTALCTALPARLGLVIIGNEGALVMGGRSPPDSPSARPFRLWLCSSPWP